MGHGMDGYGSIPARGRGIFSSPRCPDGLWGSPSLLPNWYRRLLSQTANRARSVQRLATARVQFPAEARASLYSTASRPTLGPTQPPTWWEQCVMGLGRGVDHSPQLVARSRMLELYLYSPIHLHGTLRIGKTTLPCLTCLDGIGPRYGLSKMQLMFFLAAILHVLVSWLVIVCCLVSGQRRLGGRSWIS
jgi:hypothetical protein